MVTRFEFVSRQGDTITIAIEESQVSGKRSPGAETPSNDPGAAARRLRPRGRRRKNTTDTEESRTKRPSSDPERHVHAYVSLTAARSLHRVQGGQRSRYVSQALEDRARVVAGARAYCEAVDAAVMDVAIERMVDYTPSWYVDPGAVREHLEAYPYPIEDAGVDLYLWSEFLEVLAGTPKLAVALVALSRERWARSKRIEIP